MGSFTDPRLKVLASCILSAVACIGVESPAPSNTVRQPVFGSLPTSTPIAKPVTAARHPFSLSIVSVAPAAPTAGQKVTISYVVRSLAPGTALAHITGSVAGGNPQTADGKPPTETAYLGNQEVKGSFTMSAGAVGSNLLELELVSTPCGAATTSPACAPTIYASATTMVAVVAAPAAQTVRVRIAGTSYADVHIETPEDNITPNAGYAYVSHNPNCKAGYFASGNNGNDTYFKKHDLPAGAKLVAVDFTLYGPPSMKTDFYKGGVGGSGSYGITFSHDSGNAMHVHWENTCQGTYRDINLDYSISFEVEIPKGMNLGETATDATQQIAPPTNPDGLDRVPGSSNAAIALVPEPVYFKLKSEGNGDYYTSFAPSVAGTISAIENGQSYPITLIGDKRIGAGCGTEGNVVLQPQQTTTATQFATLYGATNMHSPKTITACAQSAPANTANVEVVLTFLAD